MMKAMTLAACIALGAAGSARAREKTKSLVSGKAIGDLAVAGRLDIDLHAEFMVSRTYENDTALNWYNCGYSGGGKKSLCGGQFGDFGLHVPHHERDEKYPHWKSIGGVPAVSFDGGDVMKADFAVEPDAAGTEDMALELWLRDASPGRREAILGWQSEDGRETSAPLYCPRELGRSRSWAHLVVNCTADRETWYLNGRSIRRAGRSLVISAGHRMVLGGASATQPSFKGELVVVRLHNKAMSAAGIDHNYRGGVMLGTKLCNWGWREERDKWHIQESKSFVTAIDKAKMAEWSEGQRRGFDERMPKTFEMAEKLQHIYGERMALRLSLVSCNAKFRGDGIKYKTPIQPSTGSWMGWSGELGFGWACQGAGHINPHELVHGLQGMTGGGIQGHYWEAHANFPQTYAGVYQTVPAALCADLSMFFHALGRNYYHARLMFEHLAQTPEYGPMFISKLWYEARGGESPWIVFSRCDPDPTTSIADEFVRMAQRNLTWDYEIFGGKDRDLYWNDYHRRGIESQRYSRTLLEPVPYDTQWHRPPKEMIPQQFGYNTCPLKGTGRRASVRLSGYVNPERGSDWRMSLVSVDSERRRRTSPIVGNDMTASLDVRPGEDLYLIVAATPTKVMSINMTGDFRSFEQERFPYKVRLEGCKPLDTLIRPKPDAPGARHANGGGFVSAEATVDATAYVGPNAQVLRGSKVLGNARVEDYAVVDGSTVQDDAVVSGHALVTGGSTAKDHARVRDYGRVMHSTVEGYARVLEHGTADRANYSDYSVVKGVAHSGGKMRGTALADGSYRKNQTLERGKWFTWSWGSGKNPGEVDEDFQGLYMRFNFDKPHPFMARDDFGTTWGLLVGAPEIREDPASVKLTDTASVTEDAKRFVLPRAPGERNPRAAHRWDNYGSIMKGYLHPPVTGKYTFWVYADDNAVVSLSTDADPKNRKEMCSSKVSGMDNYTKFPEQKSEPVRLQAGEVYYIESLFKAAGGGDYMGVAWEYGGRPRAIIEGEFLSKTPDGPTGALVHRAWRNIGGGSVDNLKNDPRFSRGLRRTSNSALALNGRDQFVELQRDVACMQDVTIKADVTWNGRSGERVMEFANPNGDSLYISPFEGGRFVFSISADGKTQRMTARALPRGRRVSVMVVLSGDQGRVLFDGEEVARNDRMTLDPEDVGATVCFLGRGLDGGYFRGEIDNVAIHTIPLVDDTPPTPNPASFSTAPTFSPPDGAVMQAERGVDPLGGVEYRFEETTGALAGMKSDWSKDPSFSATGLKIGRTYHFRVTMRDRSGNTTAPSEPMSVTPKRTEDIFVQSGGREGLIVMEAENFHENIPAGNARWKVVKAEHGSRYTGSGAVLSEPDRGAGYNEDVESSAPRCDYVVRFKKPGRYWIWVRGFGRNPNSDSVHVGVDMKLEKAGTHLWTGWKMYQWVRSHQPYNIKKPGIHVVNLWVREDGTTVDKLLITSQGDYRPSAELNADKRPIGPGPVESARE